MLNKLIKSIRISSHLLFWRVHIDHMHLVSRPSKYLAALIARYEVMASLPVPTNRYSQ